MGLDQYFFKAKDYNSTEIIYFRKFYELNDFINVMVDGIQNGGLVRLEVEELQKLLDFFIENRNSFHFESFEDDFEYNRKYYEILGILTHYIKTNQVLYYGSDW